MAEIETTSRVDKPSVQLSLAFALVGIGLLYLTIADATIETKMLWASGLSLTVAFTFAIVWAMARDAMRTMEEALRRKGPA